MHSTHTEKMCLMFAMRARHASAVPCFPDPPDPSLDPAASGCHSLPLRYTLEIQPTNPSAPHPLPPRLTQDVTTLEIQPTIEDVFHADTSSVEDYLRQVEEATILAAIQVRGGRDW